MCATCKGKCVCSAPRLRIIEGREMEFGQISIERNLVESREDICSYSKTPLRSTKIMSYSSLAVLHTASM